MHWAVREAQAPVVLLLLHSRLLLGAVRVNHAVGHSREEVLNEHLGSGLQSALLQDGSKAALYPAAVAKHLY